MAKQKTAKTPAIESLNIGAAAVDIGSREYMAAVNPDVTDAPIRAFGAFIHDLHDLLIGSNPTVCRASQWNPWACILHHPLAQRGHSVLCQRNLLSID